MQPVTGFQVESVHSMEEFSAIVNQKTGANISRMPETTIETRTE